MCGASANREKIPVRVYGGPTTLIEYGGLRFVTDPTFDPPGEYPMPLPGDHKLVKTAPCPVTAADLGPVDAVLLSHDEHDDNLDNAGRAFLVEVPVVFTTVSGAGRLGGNARGLAFWQSAELKRPDGGTVTVTGLPARHGPEGCEPISGDVVGFMLTSDDLPPVYVSGDNAALEHVREIAEKFAPVDTAILFLGGARMVFAFEGALLTLDSALGAEAARILGARRVVPAHYDSWAHFKEGRKEIEAAFSEAGLADRLDLARQTNGDSSMTSTNIDIARTYFQAVQNGDMATLGALLDPGIVWHQPGANQFSGEHKGQGAVFGMLGAMMETSQGTFAIDKIHTLMGNGDLVAAHIHFTGRRGDTSMAMDGVDLLRIQNGKITEMWLFSGDQSAEDAFWGR